MYGNYLNTFRNELNSRTGFIAYEDSALRYDRNEQVFYRNWTHQLLSVLLRADSSKAIMLNEYNYNGFQGFYDPPRHIPDFSRYYGGEKSE
jgi:hypothetical protein